MCVRPAILCRAAGEMLHIAEPFLEQNLHPTVIVRGFMRALEDAIATVDSLAFPIDTSNRDHMLKTVQSCIGTKYTARFGTLMAVCTEAWLLRLLAMNVRFAASRWLTVAAARRITGACAGRGDDSCPGRHSVWPAAD